MLSSKLQLSIRDRKVFAAILALVLLCSTASALIAYDAGVKAQSSSALTMQTNSGGVYPGAPTYTIFSDGAVTPTYYAKDAYGAISWSSTNAAVPIQNGLNINYAKVALATGNFVCNSALTIPSFGHSSLMGQGRELSILSFTGTSGIVIDSANWWSISDLSISGTIVSGAYGISILASTGANGYNLVSNVEIHNFDQGIRINGLLSSTIENTHIYSCNTGMDFVNDTMNNEVNTVTIDTCTVGFISENYLNQGDTFTGGMMFGNSVNFEIYNGDIINFEGVIFDHAYGSTAYYIMGGTHIYFTNCYISGDHLGGTFSITPSNDLINDVVFSGSTISSFTTYTMYIHVDTTSRRIPQNIKFTDTTFESNGGTSYGDVFINNATHTSFSGVTFSSTACSYNVQEINLATNSTSFTTCSFAKGTIAGINAVSGANILTGNFNYP